MKNARRKVAKRQKKEKARSFMYLSALQILESTNNPRNEDRFPIIQDNDHEIHSCNSSELRENIHHSETDLSTLEQNIHSKSDLITIEQNTSNYSRMAKDFDIKAFVECTDYNRYLLITTLDDKIPLIKGDLSINATTKNQFMLHNAFGKVANLPVSQKPQKKIEN